MSGPIKGDGDYKPIDLESLQGNFRKITNPIYVPDPESLDLDQIPTLQKMLTGIHFDYIEKETELDILKQQIVAINCAISALEKVKLIRISRPKLRLETYNLDWWKAVPTHFKYNVS